MRIHVGSLLKYVLVGSIMAAVGFGSAAYLYKNETSAASVSAEVKDKNTTEQFRTERQQLRSMQKAQINEILYGEQTDAELVSMAQEYLLDLLYREEQENLLEGLLEIRGFQDVIVSIRSDSASVFVAADMLTQQESSVILDLVCRETGLLSGNVKVIPIK